VGFNLNDESFSICLYTFEYFTCGRVQGAQLRPYSAFAENRGILVLPSSSNLCRSSAAADNMNVPEKNIQRRPCADSF
jgi:hypothetical protein